MVARGFSPARTGSPFLTGLAIFVVALLWFWFWRPYGFYGGDSEYLDRQVNGGIWIRKREPLAVAAMQLARQVFTLRLGWPVGWSISLVSCLAGAVSAAVLWRLCCDRKRALLTYALTLCSGYPLLFHGSIESYALPTCLLAVWILAIQRVGEGRWPSWTLALAFAGMTWCHLMSLFLFPSLVLAMWFYRDRIRGGEWRPWLACFFLASGTYVLTDLLNIGEGLGFEGSGGLFADKQTDEFGPLLSLKHFRIKVYFLWVALQLSLPLAFLEAVRNRRDPASAQIGALALCGLGFLAIFHPDTGYRDWDLFLLPSLPCAVLAARRVASVKEASRRSALAAVLVVAFVSVWAPRIPVWARLSERGLATVRIANFPEDREVYLDDRYPVFGPTFRPPGGAHFLAVRKRGYVTTQKSFMARPGERIEVNVPIKNIEVPFSEKIRALEAED